MQLASAAARKSAPATGGVKMPKSQIVQKSLDEQQEKERSRLQAKIRKQERRDQVLQQMRAILNRYTDRPKKERYGLQIKDLEKIKNAMLLAKEYDTGLEGVNMAIKQREESIRGLEFDEMAKVQPRQLEDWEKINIVKSQPDQAEQERRQKEDLEREQERMMERERAKDQRLKEARNKSRQSTGNAIPKRSTDSKSDSFLIGNLLGRMEGKPKERGVVPPPKPPSSPTRF